MVWDKILEMARDEAEGRELMPSDVAHASETVNRDAGNRDPETARWFALLDALDFIYTELRGTPEGNALNAPKIT